MKSIHDNAKTSHDIEKAFQSNKYIVAFKSIYQPFHSPNGGYYAQEVYHGNDKLTVAGRFFHMTGEAVNHLIGIELLNNL